MNSNVQIKVLQIRLKNGAYIDAENGSAYDCSGQMIAHLATKSLEVLHCIAKHSISPAKGILAAGIATTEILNTVWSESGDKTVSPKRFVTSALVLVRYIRKYHLNRFFQPNKGTGAANLNIFFFRILPDRYRDLSSDLCNVGRTFYRSYRRLRRL